MQCYAKPACLVAVFLFLFTVLFKLPESTSKKPSIPQDNQQASAPAAKQQDVTNLHPAFEYTGEWVAPAIEKVGPAAHRGKKLDVIVK